MLVTSCRENALLHSVWWIVQILSGISSAYNTQSKGFLQMNSYIDDTQSMISNPIAPLGLYARLHHDPDAMYRRFQGGSPPSIDVLNGWRKKKRSRMDLVLAKPACPYVTKWDLLYTARDINDTEVIVYQPDNPSANDFQWFYTATCDSTRINRENPYCPNCCKGIDHSRYTSTCLPKKSYVLALVKKLRMQQYEWNWIQVDTGCNCAVSNRIHV